MPSAGGGALACGMERFDHISTALRPRRVHSLIGGRARTRLQVARLNLDQLLAAHLFLDLPASFVARIEVPSLLRPHAAGPAL